MGYALRRLWRPQRVASLLWNQWQLCRGMRGKFAMESVTSFAWNQWQLSYGTGGNFRAEYAWDLANLSTGYVVAQSIGLIYAIAKGDLVCSLNDVRAGFPTHNFAIWGVVGSAVLNILIILYCYKKS